MTAVAPSRLVSLDLIRGFALVGVLAVNAAYFAAPLQAVLNPTLPPIEVSGWTLWAWAVPYVFFEFKCITLFSMLFGVSLYLVGGERSDREKGRIVRRRLGWMALFGILHGAFLWFGDILLSYAVTGFLVLLARSWKPRRLLIVGLILFGLSTIIVALLAASLKAMPPAQLAEFVAQSWAPPPDRLHAMVAAYHQGWVSSLGANLETWVEFQIQSLLFLTPRTAGMMMIGLALFKSGFLSGERPAAVYVRTGAMGAIALAALAVNAGIMAGAGFPVLSVQGSGALLTAALSPLVSLGYASALVLVLRAGRLQRLTRALAAVGRMAFTNYLAQSLVLSSLFWSGRGLGLYGEVSRPGVMGIAAILFGAQMLLSGWWLERYSMGPLEWIWRRLTYRRPVPFRLGGSTPVAIRASGGAVPAIESRQLAKRFGAHVAVDGVDLCVPPGAIYGFLGANGAGKTTTIRLVLGLMRPTAGSVHVFGTDVARDRLGAARHIGALLEARATYDHLSGRENLDFTRRMLALPRREIERVLELVDLRDAADRKVGHYSLGMRQRLGLARAMLPSPRLLVLDEPMNGLDPDGIADMRRTIQDLPQRSGVTVFLSSHLLSEVQQVASHIGLMRQGRLVLQGRMAELLTLTKADVFVRARQRSSALDALAAFGFDARAEGDGLVVAVTGKGMNAGRVAEILVQAGIEILEMTPRQGTLEELYGRTQQLAAAA